MKRTGATKHRLSYQTKKSLKGWIFVFPFICGLLLYYFPVLVDAVRFSLSDLTIRSTELEITFVGWEHYRYALFVNPDFLKTLAVSIGTMVAEIPAILCFSLFIATILNKDMRGRAFFRMIFFIPVVMVTGVVEKYELGNILLSQMSEVQNMGSTVTQAPMFDAEAFLREIGIQSPQLVSFLTSLSEGIYSIVQKSGVQIIVFLAGLQSISPSVYEVAKMEGASGWEIFWKITFPMLMPIIFANMIYTIIDSFTRSSNGVVALIQEIGFQNSYFSAANAMALVYTIVVLAILMLVFLLAARLTSSKKRS